MTVSSTARRERLELRGMLARAAGIMRGNTLVKTWQNWCAPPHLRNPAAWQGSARTPRAAAQRSAAAPRRKAGFFKRKDGGGGCLLSPPFGCNLGG